MLGWVQERPLEKRFALQEIAAEWAPADCIGEEPPAEGWAVEALAMARDRMARDSRLAAGAEQELTWVEQARADKQVEEVRFGLEVQAQVQGTVMKPVVRAQ